MRLSFSLSVLKIEMAKKKDATVKVIGKPIQSFIGKKFYPNKPVVRTGITAKRKYTLMEYGAGLNKADEDNRKGLFDDFPVEPIDASIKNAKRAREAFDKVFYPLKTIIPNPDDYYGVKEVTLKTYKGKNNCIRYYTRVPDLSDAQCKILWEDDDIRSVFGYEINGRKMTSQMLGTFIRWLVKNEPTVGKLEQEDIVSEREYRAYKEIATPIKPNPDGSRKPIVLQMGVNSYMDRNKLINPVQIIDTHAKGEKLKIHDIINLGGVLNEMNITPQEALDYVCKYLSKNRNIKRKHTEDRELTRGASALKILIDHYKAEKKRTTILKLDKPKTKVYGYKELMGSQEYRTYCKQTGEPQLRQYESFKKWIKKRLNTLAKI